MTKGRETTSGRTRTNTTATDVTVAKICAACIRRCKQPAVVTVVSCPMHARTRA